MYPGRTNAAAPHDDSMALGTSIRIFLTDGTPNGLRLIEKSNWNGLALAGPRSIYADVRKRDEFNGPGVYILRGVSDDEAQRAQIYVGEADVVRERLDAHARSKDWWDSFVVFASKDSNLNKAYVRYIESRLIELAKTSKRVPLDNSVDPQTPRLSEADRADAEGYLENMRLIFPVLGIDAFESPRPVTPEVNRHPLLVLKGKGVSGTGRDLPEGFVVYAGATARLEAAPSIHSYMQDLRQQLLTEGVFVKADGFMRLQQDYTFRSPSTAASVLLGSSTNGRVAWTDEQGRKLKDIQDLAIRDESEGQPTE